MNNRGHPSEGLNEDGKQKQTDEKPHKGFRESTTFSWKNIGSWDSDTQIDKFKELKLIDAIQTYVIDHFYGDWYWNCSLMAGTCFFSWFFARLGGGVFSLVIVLLFTSSVYRKEFRRFNRDIRDDMTRAAAINRLDNELETMEWLNSFLDKFWVIYMPALSELVLFQANEVLKDQAPGFGIEAISLDEFTLGSKAPRVNSIKSYCRKGRDHIEMDWAFSFAPNDTDDMTKNEIKNKINPKVALGVTIGKAFVSKSLPILVEDMAFTGRMNIKLKLGPNFPHVKIVSLQFLEAPNIDYALKPVGGDTFGIDIMSFIPGLSSFVNGLIHSNLRPMLYAPNSLDIDVEEIIAQQSNDSNAVAVITINRLINLKMGPKTKPNSINPYVKLTVTGNADIEERTSVKKLTNDPVFLESKHLLLNKVQGNHLIFHAYHLNKDKADDELLGNFEFELGDLLQNGEQLGLIKNLKLSGVTIGKIDFDIRYFPALPPIELEDGTKEANTDSEIGIMKLTLHEATHLDISQSVIGLLNPYAEIFVNGDLTKKCRNLRQINHPSWNQSFESFITKQSETKIEILVRDSVENQVVARLNTNLQDLVFETSRGQEWFTCHSQNNIQPKIRVTANWKAISMGEEVSKAFMNPPIGGLILHIRSANGLKNLESVGKVDPYVRIINHGKVVAKTKTIADSLDPFFNSVYYLPVDNEHLHFLLEFMDEEDEAKDRSLGTAAINIGDLIQKKNGYYLEYDGADEIIKQDILLHGKAHGSLSYSVSFFPTIPIYSIAQSENKEAYLEELKKEETKKQEKAEKDLKLAKEYPDEYELVDVDEETNQVAERIEMSTEEAIKYRVGIINVHILEGTFDSQSVYVHTLFDEQAHPAGVSDISEGHRLKTKSTADGFIRDLPNSKLILRIAKKVDVNDEKDIVIEKIFNTQEVLMQSNKKAIDLSLNERNKVKVKLEFIPSDVKLHPLDTILDIGKVEMNILEGENLLASDYNGKSDPYVSVKLDGIEVYKTDKKKKTLNPVWKEAFQFPILSRSKTVVTLEVYDWDLARSNDFLGVATLDLSTLEPMTPTPFIAELNTQGNIKLSVNFIPEYIRPKLNSSTGLPIDLRMVSHIPFKLAGGAADFAGNAVGAGFGLASGGASKGLGLAAGGASKGGSILKGIGRGFRGKDSHSSKDTSSHSDAADAASTRDATSTRDTTFQDEDHLVEQHSEVNSSFNDKGDYLNKTRSPQSPQKQEKEKNSMDVPSHKSLYGNDVQSLRSGVNAVPNINPDLLPPPLKPLGHFRNVSNATDASSYIESIHGSGAIPGRISIVSASGYSASGLTVKATLKTSSKDKELCKTRAAKSDPSNNYKWNESFPFKATPSSQIEFTLREYHKLARNVEVGSAILDLSTMVDKNEHVNLPIGDGELTLNVRYVRL